jgi:hypothetical protein
MVFTLDDNVACFPWDIPICQIFPLELVRILSGGDIRLFPGWSVCSKWWSRNLGGEMVIAEGSGDVSGLSIQCVSVLYLLPIWCPVSTHSRILLYSSLLVWLTMWRLRKGLSVSYTYLYPAFFCFYPYFYFHLQKYLVPTILKARWDGVVYFGLLFSFPHCQLCIHLSQIC